MIDWWSDEYVNSDFSESSYCIKAERLKAQWELLTANFYVNIAEFRKSKSSDNAVVICVRNQCPI